jgi:hypothetical protein
MKLRPLHRALLLGALHLILVASLGGKLLVDRATRPRFWLKTAPVDPSLPIRGRYVSLRVEVPVRGAELPPPEKAEDEKRPPWMRRDQHWIRVSLEARPEGLIATQIPPRPGPGLPPPAEGPEEWPVRVSGRLSESLRELPLSQWVVELREPLAFFIPEGVPDPGRRAPGEELWVEVTLPKKGPLRPIRLGVKREGRLEVLNL